MKSLFLLIALAAQCAFAQSAPTAANTSETKTDKEKRQEETGEAAPEESKVLKKIVVTGSYIKKAPDQKAPTPVSITDKTKLQESATFTVAGALSEDSAFSSGAFDVFLTLHGQTEADNLVLMNGLRLPKTAGGSGVNIDFIPAVVMERTETLKDGASALYGSEALAGVVNVVTTKEKEGTSFYYRLSSPETGGGQETTVSVSNGAKIGKHHYVAAFQLRKDTPARSTDDQYGRFVNLVDPQSASDYTTQGLLIGDAGLGTLNCPPGHLDADGLCHLDLKSYGASEDAAYYMAYADYGYDFSDTLKFNSLFSYTKRHWYATGVGPLIDMNDGTALGRPDFSIPVAIANSWGTTDANGAPLNYTVNPRLLYRANEELGTTISKRDVDNYVAQAELTKEFGQWDADLAVGYGLTFFRDVTLQGNADKQKVWDLINAGQFNPFKPTGAKDDIRSATYQSWFQHTSDVVNPKLVVTGPVTDKISIAVGADTQWQSFKFGYDPLSQQGLALTAQSGNQVGDRNVYSGFIELDYNPTKQWDIQLAGRYDKYSDFGSTLNPKIGIAYHPTDALTFRGSYGTGFKAPDLLAIYQARNSNPTRFRDEVQCEKDPNSAACRNGIWPVTTEGNKNLDPETAEHFNIGTIVTPTKDFLIGADYWHVDGEAGLSALSPTTVTLAERNGVNLAQYGIIVNRQPGTDNITNMYIPARINAGIFRIRGLDIAMKKRGTWNTKWWGPVAVAFTIDHSHILHTEGTDFPVEPFRAGYNQGWNNIMGLSFSKDNNYLKFQARTNPGGDEDIDEGKGVGKGSTNMATVYDMHYERYLKNDSSINFGIRNIMGQHWTSEVDGQRFVYAGGPRTLYMGYQKEF